MKTLKIAAIGTEHRHIFGQLKGMLDLGCECVGWWNDGDNKITDDFTEKYPTIKREIDKNNLLSNPEIDLVLIADIPSKRADLAIELWRLEKMLCLINLDAHLWSNLNELNKQY
jgi:predicted dehydrogenase